MPDEQELGKVVHYYDKIMVAVVNLKKGVKVGDSLHFVGRDEDFNQEVASLQVEHEQVDKAESGTEVAIKVDQPVKKNWRVYRPS